MGREWEGAGCGQTPGTHAHDCGGRGAIAGLGQRAGQGGDPRAGSPMCRPRPESITYLGPRCVKQDAADGGEFVVLVVVLGLGRVQ